MNLITWRLISNLLFAGTILAGLGHDAIGCILAMSFAILARLYHLEEKLGK